MEKWGGTFSAPPWVPSQSFHLKALKGFWAGPAGPRHHILKKTPETMPKLCWMFPVTGTLPGTVAPPSLQGPRPQCGLICFQGFLSSLHMNTALRWVQTLFCRRWTAGSKTTPQPVSNREGLDPKPGSSEFKAETFSYWPPDLPTRFDDCRRLRGFIAFLVGSWSF